MHAWCILSQTTVHRSQCYTYNIFTSESVQILTIHQYLVVSPSLEKMWHFLAQKMYSIDPNFMYFYTGNVQENQIYTVHFLDKEISLLF